MLEIRKAQERGHAQHGWLDSHHSFSFANYHDPKHMGFRALRVINEDRVEPGAGFGTHQHNDMEILSYVLEGTLEHRDSMGNGSLIRPGDVQRMSAGTGVRHSEKNPSPSEPVHFLQIWLIPGQRGLPPSYEQKAFSAEERSGQLRLIASPDGREGSLTINTDTNLYSTLLAAGQSATLPLPAGRHVWVQVVRGKLRVQDRELGAGDGAALSNEATLSLQGVEDAELLVFDLA